MKIICAEKLTHLFKDIDEEGNVKDENKALDGVDIEVEKGQFIAVLGHNGSGKSTFAKHINALLLPDGGSMTVNGFDTKNEDNIWDIRQSAGMVFQNPDNQIIATVVEDDIGFGPENMGVPTDEIWHRVNDALKAVDMEKYRHHSPNKLSGGQKQRVAIAGVVAMKPECIVLDEPTAMLDPNGRKEVINTIHRLNKEEGVTIILITHYMNEVIDADKIFVMDKGKVVMSGEPREIFSRVDEIKALGLDVPQVTEVAYRLGKQGYDMGDCVISVNEFVEKYNRLRLKSEKKSIAKVIAEKNLLYKNNVSDVNKTINEDTVYTDKTKEKISEDKCIIDAWNLTYIYGEDTNNRVEAVSDVSLKIYEGEFLGIIGHTGSGKSTLIQHLNGLIKPTEGQVFYKGADAYGKDFSMSSLRRHVGLVFQYPEYQLFKPTIFEDVCFGPENLGKTADEVKEAAGKALDMVGITEDMYDKSPFDLSGGQKRRVAIAGVLAMNPDVLILDEPTAGLDPKGRDEILNQLKKLQKERGISIVVVSHSMEDMALYADRIVVMSSGKKIYDDTPKKVFSHYKELEKIGLCAPQVTYLLNAIEKNGENETTDIKTEKNSETVDLYTVTTVDEAVEICRSALC